MLQVEGVWFRWARDRDWVLRDVDLQVEPAGVVGLCGPSGGGKSSLGRVLAGFAEPDRGRVTVDGAVPRVGRGRPHPVQLVLQHAERAVDPRWSIREVLDSAGDPDDVVGELVDPRWLDRRPHELSGGQLQRVSLARALTARPRYLVADEISASLDAITQAQLWHLLLDHCRGRGIGVLAISHDPALLEQVASQVVEWPAGAAVAT